jgi:hypothetical protein
MKAAEVIELLNSRFLVATRAKLKGAAIPSKWGTWFLIPVPNYVEASTYGPVPTREVEWIELDPIVQRPIGRLVPPQIMDHTPELLQQLAEHGISTQLVEGRIRVRLSAT